MSEPTLVQRLREHRTAIDQAATDLVYLLMPDRKLRAAEVDRADVLFGEIVDQAQAALRLIAARQREMMSVEVRT